jgi:hypothetical protein
MTTAKPLARKPVVPLSRQHETQLSGGKDLPKMLMFCDWLSETKIIIVRDSFVCLSLL